MRNKLIEFIETNKLIHPQTSMLGLSESIEADGYAVLYGMGLCTSRQMSEGMPFDSLAYFVTGVELLKNNKSNKIIHFIPDTTARVNSFYDQIKAEKLAGYIKNTFLNLAENFGVRDKYYVILASDYHHKKEYLDIVEHINANIRFDDSTPVNFKPYIIEQLSDMAYLNKYYDARLKISWLLDPNSNGKCDERMFDGYYRNVFGEHAMSMIYTYSGRSFDSKSFRLCPYTSSDNKKRIMLSDSKEDIATKLVLYKGEKVAKQAEEYLHNICERFEKLIEDSSFKDKNLSEKIAYINSLGDDRNINKYPVIGPATMKLQTQLLTSLAYNSQLIGV
jgi:hypothetical protein